MRNILLSLLTLPPSSSSVFSSLALFSPLPLLCLIPPFWTSPGTTSQTLSPHLVLGHSYNLSHSVSLLIHPSVSFRTVCLIPQLSLHL
ncbi:hypothetical protein GDO86_015047 [Hymenochirus boettgeri]|uniref:Secreted protein n=1 Tax=Hymenochirus boettgeri TaxID=247094 RepID=A0A8T2JV52_9PIPI|nr:hypothetical protein GDO86_015047 [Hymenochirus boettgeri]